MQLQDIEQAQIDRDQLTSVAANIAKTEAYLPRHRDTIDKLGLSSPNQQGCDRLVFRTGEGTVIKIPRAEDRIDINYDESAIWSQYGGCNIFAPILETGPSSIWIEMVWCQPPENEDHAISIFREKIEETPIEIYDLHADNIGWFNGELVCYDYPEVHIQREGFY
jgi:hypothetical protein